VSYMGTSSLGLLAGVAAFAANAWADTAKPRATTILPCGLNSADYAAAKKELSSINDAIGALAPAAEFSSLLARIRALAESYPLGSPPVAAASDARRRRRLERQAWGKKRLHGAAPV